MIDRLRNKILQVHNDIFEAIETIELELYGHINKMDSTRISKKMMTWTSHERYKRCSNHP